MRIIKLEGNVSVNMKGIICEELQDDMHVYVLLEGKTHLSSEDLGAPFNKHCLSWYRGLPGGGS